jgi:hypothetical protein
MMILCICLFVCSFLVVSKKKYQKLPKPIKFIRKVEKTQHQNALLDGHKGHEISTEDSEKDLHWV